MTAKPLAQQHRHSIIAKGDHTKLARVFPAVQSL